MTVKLRESRNLDAREVSALADRVSSNLIEFVQEAGPLDVPLLEQLSKALSRGTAAPSGEPATDSIGFLNRARAKGESQPISIWDAAIRAVDRIISRAGDRSVTKRDVYRVLRRLQRVAIHFYDIDTEAQRALDRTEKLL